MSEAEVKSKADKNATNSILNADKALRAKNAGVAASLKKESVAETSLVIDLKQSMGGTIAPAGTRNMTCTTVAVLGSCLVRYKQKNRETKVLEWVYSMKNKIGLTFSAKDDIGAVFSVHTSVVLSMSEGSLMGKIIKSLEPTPPQGMTIFDLVSKSGSVTVEHKTVDEKTYANVKDISITNPALPQSTLTAAEVPLLIFNINLEKDIKEILDKLSPMHRSIIINESQQFRAKDIVIPKSQPVNDSSDPLVGLSKKERKKILKKDKGGVLGK